MRYDEGSGAVPLILFILAIIAAGAIYTLCFLTILPSLYVLVPDSVFKIFIIYGVFYFAPAIVLVVGILALITSGMKRSPDWVEVH